MLLGDPSRPRGDPRVRNLHSRGTHPKNLTLIYCTYIYLVHDIKCAICCIMRYISVTDRTENIDYRLISSFCGAQAEIPFHTIYLNIQKCSRDETGFMKGGQTAATPTTAVQVRTHRKRLVLYYSRTYTVSTQPGSPIEKTTMNVRTSPAYTLRRHNPHIISPYTTSR